MLKQHSQFIISLLVLSDACAVAVSWGLSYGIRFTWLPVDMSKGVPDFGDRYLTLLPIVILAHVIIFARVGLYRPRRDRTVVTEMRDSVKSFVAAVLAVILIDYAMPETSKISRRFILTYAVLGTTLFTLFRIALRVTLHDLRRRGWNQRSAAIIGTGRIAQRLLHALRQNGWTGIDVLYFVDDQTPGQPTSLRDLPVRGPLKQVSDIFEQHPVDAVFVALPALEAHRTEEVLHALEKCMADVRLVPEINPTFAMRPDVSELDGVPILSIRQTPLYGWNAILKRVFDVVVGTICLLVALIPLGIIALLIRIKSGSPIFYRQRRMGLDGQEFRLIKFRTMKKNAEAETGPVWADPNDPRRTRLGSFLRRTSLDELPNLFNVLAGHMSLVGPRPERPELIQRFKQEIPQYMLRHKMKAGMTGYAQIKGFRGRTSLRKRVQHDMHYIRNWSLGLDMRILAQTLTGAWFSKHET